MLHHTTSISYRSTRIGKILWIILHLYNCWEMKQYIDTLDLTASKCLSSWSLICPSLHKTTMIPSHTGVIARLASHFGTWQCSPGILCYSCAGKCSRCPFHLASARPSLCEPDETVTFNKRLCPKGIFQEWPCWWEKINDDQSRDSRVPQFQTTPNGVTLSYTFRSKLQEDSIPVDLENISKLQFPQPGPSTSPKPYHPRPSAGLLKRKA